MHNINRRCCYVASFNFCLYNCPLQKFWYFLSKICIWQLIMLGTHDHWAVRILQKTMKSFCTKRWHCRFLALSNSVLINVSWSCTEFRHTSTVLLSRATLESQLHIHVVLSKRFSLIYVILLEYLLYTSRNTYKNTIFNTWLYLLKSEHRGLSLETPPPRFTVYIPQNNSIEWTLW